MESRAEEVEKLGGREGVAREPGRERSEDEEGRGGGWKRRDARARARIDLIRHARGARARSTCAEHAVRTWHLCA
eukprot:6182089-Pleurochrysis_carterae.AAC.3